MKRKFTAAIAGLLILVIAAGAGGLYFIYRKNNTPIVYEDVIKYEVQTHEYFPDAPRDNKYHINSQDELNEFYSIYSDELAIDTTYLEQNDILIQVQSEGPGSIQHKLEQVVIQNKKLSFQISTITPEIGTADMAFWYYVAIIPKDKLSNVNLNDWKTPSQIKQ
ncbi:MAG: hypothetical protein K6F57_05060 [Candidatus Saccharibacteria bacterium]|nr:hypothetical protein [Candidatus Saccharibacteria bacterium]